MNIITIKDRETDEVVHTVEVHFPKDSSQYDRMMDGLYRKVDFERYYLVEPGDEE